MCFQKPNIFKKFSIIKVNILFYLTYIAFSNMESDELANDDESINLAFYFEYRQLFLKFVCEKGNIKVYYEKREMIENEDTIDTMPEFKYIGRIVNNHNKGTTMCAQGIKSCFNFLIIASENTDLKLIDLIGSENISYLNTGLHKVLTNSGTKNTFDPIIMIATYDGLLYTLTVTNCSNENANVLLNTLSPILYISSYTLKSPFDKLFSNNKTNTELCNCLYLITECGKLYTYSYVSSYKFKAFQLPHNIRTCINYNQHYIYYCTEKNEIYKLNLNSLNDSSIQSNYIQTCCAKYFYISKTDNQLYAKTYSGDQIKIEELSLDSKDITSVINQVYSISDQIMQKQVELDNLNKLLKQIQLLKKLETNIEKNQRKTSYFDISLDIKKIDSNVYFFIYLKNLSVAFEECLDEKQSFCYRYMLLTSIKFDELNERRFTSTNKTCPFKALAPTCTQKISIDLSEHSSCNDRPCQLALYLLLDINPQINEHSIENIPEEDHLICIHCSKIELSECIAIQEEDDESIARINNYITGTHLDEIDKNFNWDQIKIKNIDYSYLQSVCNAFKSSNFFYNRIFIDITVIERLD